MPFAFDVLVKGLPAVLADMYGEDLPPQGSERGMVPADQLSSNSRATGRAPWLLAGEDLSLLPSAWTLV